MNCEDIRDKIFIFQKKIEDECYTYGWGRAIRCASQIYADNLNLEAENDILFYKMDKYKSETQRLKKMIDIEIKGIVDEMTDKIIENESKEQNNRFIVRILKE